MKLFSGIQFLLLAMFHLDVWWQPLIIHQKRILSAVLDWILLAKQMLLVSPFLGHPVQRAQIAGVSGKLRIRYPPSFLLFASISRPDVFFFFFASFVLIFLQACTFLARSDHIIPTTRLAYKFSDYAKPKARENVAAELKLGLLSLSVLDNFCGTVSSLVILTLVLERRRFSLLIYCINAYFWFGSDDTTSWHNSDKYESCYAWEFSGNKCCSNMFNCFIHIQQTNRGMGASNWTIWCHIQVILCTLYFVGFQNVKKKGRGLFNLQFHIFLYFLKSGICWTLLVFSLLVFFTL